MNPSRAWGLQWSRPLWVRWRRGDFYPQKFVNAAVYYWNKFRRPSDRGDKL